LTCETSDIITPSSTAAAALGLPEDEEGKEEEAAAVGLHAAGGEE
jgi:hypothetical protein